MRVRIFVKRGQFERHSDLHRIFASTTPTDVAWDRRVKERRRVNASTGEERRQRDRRGPAPASWTTLGFVVAYVADSPRQVRW